jgi:hypothetical protein
VFSFPRILTDPYTEPDGTRVYVDGPRILRFSPDGRLEYRDGSAPGESAGRYVIPRSGPEVTDEDRIEAARALADRIVPDSAAPDEEAAVRLASVRPLDEARVEVSLRLFLNGIPLTEPSVRVIFDGDIIIGAELPLRRYTRTADVRVLLPGEQAAAALAASGRPLVVLDEREDGLLIPLWLVW